ncbi:nuclease-related domain-containing protein [Desulforamulus ferrireducens]|uniref:NERD domain-containing protein n=1 Tax=Desulforamulus ferrireducens TaxID=1833852 RepID=A0A1S6IVQ3_9FIRM|nr:nuclease-related domain-containing protein [Desulforamulus ferrireducens]AQS58851.1 hypothetical protein B0537_06990 [Desulforamulus ferrireducens]
MARVLRWPGKMPVDNHDEPRQQGLLGWLKTLFSSKAKTPDKGLAGEWKVAKALADYLDDRWTVANNLKISLSTGKAQIDHLLFGPEAIYCIETKNWHSASCNAKEEWFRLQGRLWIPQDSPVEQNKRKVEQLRKLLQQQDINIKVENIIVFANPGKFDFHQAKWPREAQVFGLPGLITYLKQMGDAETGWAENKQPSPETILALIR